MPSTKERLRLEYFPEPPCQQRQRSDLFGVCAIDYLKPLDGKLWCRVLPYNQASVAGASAGPLYWSRRMTRFHWSQIPAVIPSLQL
jgi:hypothetical protein